MIILIKKTHLTCHLMWTYLVKMNKSPQDINSCGDFCLYEWPPTVSIFVSSCLNLRSFASPDNKTKSSSS